MSQLQQTLETILRDALAAVKAAADARTLEDLRVRLLGRKGTITGALKELGGLTAAERPLIGKLANDVKQQVQAALDARVAELAARRSVAGGIDVTLPGRRHHAGTKNPLSQVMDECVEILRRMGFVVAAGPDIEDEYHNFDALNTPDDHPARDIQDTLYFDDGRLLRTQTSPVQVRVMEHQRPPVRIVSPGRCYRRDTPDATHSLNFHQIEGLYIDRRVSLADLKGTMQELAREIFGPATEIRFRPHFFPFTEPSIECDARFAGGKWLEIAGAGMVHPLVLKNVGYDSEEYTGFAFGMGIERIAMIKYDIRDIRLFYENDLRFLCQF